jgi:seryl-tRNA(Sec) selenium transferase
MTMTDIYQATYEAVRSKISGGNIGETVRDVAGNAFDISHAVAMVRDEMLSAAYDMHAPHVLMRPELTLDGDQWCALYGKDLMDGVAGFGDTPLLAMEAFDKAWRTERTPVAARQIKAIADEEVREAAHAHSQFGVGA